MNWLKRVIFFIIATILVYGCASTNEQITRSDFRAICQAVSPKGGGKISKQDFLAAAKDKEKAEEVFLMCDVNKDNYLTENEVWEREKVKMMQNVLRLTEPR